MKKSYTSIGGFLTTFEAAAAVPDNRVHFDKALDMPIELAQHTESDKLRCFHFLEPVPMLHYAMSADRPHITFL